MHDSGQAKLVIRYENWLTNFIVNLTNIDEDLHLLIDPVPTQPDWRTRWGGKIHQINMKKNEDGSNTIELLAISHREHAKKLMIAANPIFAPEVQLPRMWILPGNTRTILWITFMINLFRLYFPGLNVIDNLLNPVQWIDTDLLNINPLHFPIQVAFVNPVTDQSRTSVVSGTWTDWHTATEDMLKDSGVIMRAYTWLTTDADTPHTELVSMINTLPKVLSKPLDHLVRPTRNCVVFSLEDMSGQTGPTGTALDGLLNLIGVTLDDLFTTVLIDGNTGLTLNGEPLVDVNGDTPVFESLLGVAPAPPKAIWRDGHYSGTVESQHTQYKGAPQTIMTGGHSPVIVNEGISFGIKYGLAQLSQVIDEEIGAFLSLNPGNLALQVPATPGLDNLYQGQLSDVFFAWERLTDPSRAAWNGDLAYQEYFERGSATAYTLSSVLTLREGDYKTRAYEGFVAKVRNGMPWLLDVDVRLGERAGFERDGVIYVDQITAIKRTWDREKPVLCSLSIGDDKDKSDPISRGMRALASVWQVVGALAGQGTLFAN